MNDDVRGPEWNGDALAEMVGRELSRRDSAAWAHEPFLEWLGAERRAGAERRLDAAHEAATMRSAGARLRARLLARQCGVRIVETPPPLVAPERRALPSAVLDEAASAGAAPLVDLPAAAGAGRAIWDEPADLWVALPEGVGPARRVALRIAGESMAPLLRPGDTVLVDLDAPIARGRVVVARRAGIDDGYLCKRVERVGRREVVLGSIDPAYGALSIPRDGRLILGTVRVAWRAP